ncbi:hypothetical protein TUN199_10438 [Pyrenophora tritici-repentis]|nr:hypothetical protein PtrV1_06496 [Pyrenophora tritici-repentis]KAI0605297.1 hypothetical protein TUN205_10451 [Pyrenophora tritici-repentis]KAI0617565.1 hypothetical protein TUN199_10438 [Pyrenophora tritici-repentis]
MSSYQPAPQIEKEMKQGQQAASLVAIGQQPESNCQKTQRPLEDVNFEEAYRSECKKLQQSVAERKTLEGENDSLTEANTYFRKELIPSYNNVLQLYAQIIGRTNDENRELKAENQELKAKSKVLEEEYARALGLLEEQDQQKIQVLSEARLSHDLQSPPVMRKRLRSCESANED